MQNRVLAVLFEELDGHVFTVRHPPPAPRTPATQTAVSSSWCDRPGLKIGRRFASLDLSSQFLQNHCVLRIEPLIPMRRFHDQRSEAAGHFSLLMAPGS